MKIHNFYLITFSNTIMIIDNLKKNPGDFRLRDRLGASGTGLVQFAGRGGEAASGRHGVCPCPPSLHRSSGTALWTQSAGEDVCLRDEEATSQSQPGKRDTLLFHHIYREMRLTSHLWIYCDTSGPACTSVRPPSLHLADDDLICFPVMHTEMFDR